MDHPYRTAYQHPPLDHRIAVRSLWLLIACTAIVLAAAVRLVQVTTEPVPIPTVCVSGVQVLRCPRGELAVAWDADGGATAVCTVGALPVEIVRRPRDLRLDEHLLVGNASGE